MELSLPWPPSANAYWRAVRGRVIVSQEARAYKSRVAYLCLSQKLKPMPGLLGIEVVFCPPDRRKRDCHNLTKVLFDALEGYLYENDNQLVWVNIQMKEEIVTNGTCSIRVRPIEFYTKEGEIDARWT